MKLSGNLRWSLALMTLLYLGLPVLMFFLCWLKPVWAVLAVAPMLYCGQYLARVWPAEPAPFRRGEIIFAAIFGLALTLFVGMGGFAPQQIDWFKHNAVLYDCVKLPWPVTLEIGPYRWPLVYYLAWYLPAAAVGKIGGFGAAEVGLWLWSAGGVMLACLWFARLARCPVRFAAAAFFCFSGLDLVGDFLMQCLGRPNRIWGVDCYPNQAWSGMWQFPSHFWMLAWAPGQALGGWLAAGLFLGCAKSSRPAVFVFLLTCALLWSPFVGVGLCLLGFFFLIQEGLTLPVKPLGPILSLILPLAVLVAFYAAKMSPEISDEFPPIPIAWFTHSLYSHGPGWSVFIFVLFVILEFGIFLGFIRARFPKGSSERRLAWACGLALVCLLPVTVGTFSDLSLRGPVVPLFCLAVLTLRTLVPNTFKPQTRDLFRLVVLLACLTPVCEIFHVGASLFIRSAYQRPVPDHTSAVINMPNRAFVYLGAQYVGSTNSFFFRNLAR